MLARIVVFTQLVQLTKPLGAAKKIVKVMAIVLKSIVLLLLLLFPGVESSLGNIVIIVLLLLPLVLLLLALALDVDANVP